jgi:hypothetical protein
MSRLTDLLDVEQPTLFDVERTDSELIAALERHPELPRTPEDRALEGSMRAGLKWTPEQVAAVDAAIAGCVTFLPFWTADDIWQRLPKDFPVTKGLAARLNAAAKRGLCQATDRTRKSSRGGDHDHGQRLTIWRSL